MPASWRKCQHIGKCQLDEQSTNKCEQISVNLINSTTSVQDIELENENDNTIQSSIIKGLMTIKNCLTIGI